MQIAILILFAWAALSSTFLVIYLHRAWKTSPSLAKMESDLYMLAGWIEAMPNPATRGEVQRLKDRAEDISGKYDWL